MARRRLRPLFDKDPKRSAIDEALTSVRAAEPADDEKAGATTEQKAEEKTELTGTREAETEGLPTRSILTPEELAANLGDTDPAGEPAAALDDPSSGLKSARERLAGADVFDSVKADEASAQGKDSSMISEGTGSFFGDMIKGLKGAAEPVKTTEEGEVISTAGQEGTNREMGSAYSGAVIGGLEDLLWAEKAIDSAGGSGGSGGGSSPAGGTGSGGSTGTGSTGTDSTGSGETGDQGESDPVMHEQDNEDGSHTTVYENGDIVTTYPDGTVEHNYADGTIETDYPDGTMKTENPDGSTETIHPDGTVETTPPTEATDEEDTGEEETDDETDDEETDDEETDDEETEGEETEAGGGAEMEGDPDGEEGAPLPEEFQRWIDTDLTAMKQRLQPVGSGDGVTDPDPNAEPVVATGPVPDAHAELGSMLGRPAGPDDMYGTGAGVDPGSAPGHDSGVIDPAPDADTGVQTAGPEERTTGGSVAGLEPPATGSAASEEDSDGDDPDGISDLAIRSPLRDVIGPVRLAPGADESEGPDDADD